MSNNQYGFYEIVENDEYSIKVYIDFHNKRVKLTQYEGNAGKISAKLTELCIKHGLGKIISTIYSKDTDAFCNNGYIIEGVIPGFFKGEPGYCTSFFALEERASSTSLEEENTIVNKAKELKNQYENTYNDIFQIKTATENHVEQLAYLFNAVFETYPTPINNPDYIKKVMNNHVLFKIAEYQGQIVSAASADINPEFLNAEITDCATLREFRGKGLLSQLIYSLEQQLRQRNLITLFSLSRSLSAGINIVLSKHGYEYTGRLINNCDIMGKFEDMNIWVKNISE